MSGEISEISEGDVVVVDAGPVGLLMAIELALGGVRVTVLERLAEPSLAMKAGGIGPLGCEALQRRGMAAALDDAEARAFAALQQTLSQPGAELRSRTSSVIGHFAGLSLLRRDAQAEPQRQPRPVKQQAIEALLAGRAAALGIEVRRGCEVTGFTQRDDGIDVAWTSPAGDATARCAYLVGCDGGRSRIRKLAGFAFPGTPPTSTFYQAMVDVDRPERLLPVGWQRTAGGVFSYGPAPGRLVMLDFSGPPQDRDAPLECAEVEAVLRRVSGQDVRVTAVRGGSRWGDNARLVGSYRQGRVLLAGDAAHVHSPLGGQGLGLGLADAANLGWKLAAVLRGDLPDTLLDTYTAERRPAAEAALANCLAQIALLRPDPQTGALRDLMARLLQLDDVNRALGASMRGLCGGNEAAQPIGDRPVGHGTLYELMQAGEGVLLDATPGAEASRLAAGVPGLRCVAVEEGPSLLVRPDACIAWTGESSEGLAPALRQWFHANAAPA